MSVPLRVRFLIPFFTATGGIRVVYEHASRLARRGHDVLLVAPRLPLGAPWRAAGRRALRSWAAHQLLGGGLAECSRYGLRDRAVRVGRLDAASVPSGDVLVATAWRTAEDLLAFPAAHGARAYFLQDWEVDDPADSARVEATWRHPFHRIAVSEWLRRWGHERLGLDCDGPVGNGVDNAWFHPAQEPPGREAATVLGCVYDATPRKAPGDLVATLHEVARRRPATRFLVFGRYRLRHRLPTGARYILAPSFAKIAELYRRMRVFVHTSAWEGWGLPPMEAMASGCAVVTTRVGGVPEFADERTARILEPGDVAGLARAALELLDAPNVCEALGRAAREKVLPMTWERATDRFEEALRRVPGVRM